MKKYIIKVIIFSIPIFIVAVTMEVFLRNIPNDYLLKKEYLDEYSSEIENLILGSSHTFYGVDPFFFSNKTFNASNISQSLDFDFEILKKYQSNFKSLKTMILPVSYFTLFGNLEMGAESWRIKNYTIYYDIKTSNSLTSNTEIFSNSLYTNLKKLGSYYLLKHSPISCTKLGWGTGFSSNKAKDLIKTGEIAAKRHTKEEINSDKNELIFRENLILLNKIITWCNDKDVQVILLTPPAYSTYYKNLNSEQLERTIETINEVASMYNNCMYLNLITDTNFIAKDFYDADHLSEIGAKKLSTLLDKQIVKRSERITLKTEKTTIKP